LQLSKNGYMPNKKKTKLTHSGLVVFLRELLLHPTAMGAACPSSNKLARSIAQHVPMPTDNAIVELGGGTGVITAGLLARGIAADKLAIIERSSALTHHLRKRFPDLNIINGDACQLSQLLNTESHSISAVVSSLPLRTLPRSTVRSIGKEIDRVLEQNGLFIQFTYSLFSSPLSPSTNLRRVHKQYVWWNLPPARVDVFKRHN